MIVFVQNTDINLNYSKRISKKRHGRLYMYKYEVNEPNIIKIIKQISLDRFKYSKFNRKRYTQKQTEVV